jgi:hypothetical protein
MRHETAWQKRLGIGIAQCIWYGGVDRTFFKSLHGHFPATTHADHRTHEETTLNGHWELHCRLGDASCWEAF